MATNIFPGVYTTIVDESFTMQPLPGTIGFICLFSEKGPDNVPRMTTSVQDLINTYGVGNPAKYGQGWYIAKQYLSILGNLYVLRALPDDAGFANLGLKYDIVSGSVKSVSFEDVASVAAIGTHITNGDVSIIFYPVGRGSWYNNIAVKLTSSSEYAGLFDCYNIDIYQKTVEDEYVIAESFLISFDKDAVDYTNESLFVEHVLDRYSQLLRAKVADNIDLTQDWSTPFTTYLNLQKGDDGTLFNATTGFLDWTKGTPLLIRGYTGALTNPFNGNLNDEITDPECLLFSVVFDAGYPSEVKDAIVDLCDIRTDCFAFLDNGDNPSPTAAITARTTDHNYNNYRAALFEMYTKVYDAYTGKYYWFSPIYHFAKAFAKTDRDYDLWWPTAGLTRGVVDGIKDIRYKLVGGYKDQFKLNQLNPIMRWSNGGDCIWGNWTTQKRPSALQNIHVVLTLLYIKRVLEWNLKYYIFDLNDEYTWELIKGNVSAFLGELRSKRALEWFKVKVFADDYDKKLNRCQVQINLQITGAIEVISITLTVQ